ncbi:MAG: glycosyltransferase family 4 protein [Ignavibacteriaceae bacterium]
MNILFLCDEYPPCNHGGIGSVTQTLARELAKKGQNIFVVGFYPYFRKGLKFENDEGVKVYRLFYGNWLTLQFSRRNFWGRILNIENEFNSYIRFLYQFIKNNKIDLIEIPDFNETFRYSGQRLIKFPDFNIPTIVKLHGTYNFISYLTNNKFDTKNIYSKEKSLIDNATKVIATSKFIKEEVKKIFSYNKEITVIYNGIFTNNKIDYVNNSSDTVIFAGKLTENKGIFSLIRAWKKVILLFPNAKLLLYGNGNKKDIQKLNELLDDKTRKSIELKGFIRKENLTNIYKSVSCAIFPSYAESFGMAPIESMQVGCPTIFTRRASGQELITDKVNGLLVDPDNIDEIADAIILMLTNRKSAIEMGENGFETIRDKFDISKIAEIHIKFYKSIL